MKSDAILFSIFLILMTLFSCKETPVQPNFKDQEKMSIYDYIVANEQYSDFLEIMKAGHLDKTLSAYNPDGLGYTLFLPDNGAVQKFIDATDQYTSLDDILRDTAFDYVFSRYHVVNSAIDANDFPFGALPDYTLSGDLLTVSFVLGTDTAYYKINNQAPVIRENIEVSNGFIHLIGEALIPVTHTTYGWLNTHPAYSIFRDAIDATGMQDVLDFNLKDEANTSRPVTLLLEADSVFNRKGIHSLDDLIAKVSPANSDYTNSTNPLHNFVGYHILQEAWFLDDFTGNTTNYNTYSSTPLNINGEGIDIAINKGKQIYDTIVENLDTTIIDYITFYYDQSNVITQSGAIQFINRIMIPQEASRANMNFEFYGEPLLDIYRQDVGSYLIEDTSALNNIKWSGADLNFIQGGQDDNNAWSNNYLQLDGSFSITYHISKIVPGKYTVILRAQVNDPAGATVELYIDGKIFGELIDLSGTRNADNITFNDLTRGEITFSVYEEHTIEIRSFIPGIFLWDNIRFNIPKTN